MPAAMPSGAATTTETIDVPDVGAVDDAARRRAMTRDESASEDEDEEYLGRIRRRARTREDESESEEDAREGDGSEDGDGEATRGRGEGRRRRLKRANGERVEREVDGSDSSDSSESELDEEMMMERKYAETGRLTDEDIEEEAEETVRGAYDEASVGYSSDSSLGSPVAGDDEPASGGRPRKMTKKQMKKEREALAKEQERMMKRAQRRAKFPGWDAEAVRVSYLPLIEKLRAAVAHMKHDGLVMGEDSTTKEADKATKTDAPGGFTRRGGVAQLRAAVESMKHVRVGRVIGEDSPAKEEDKATKADTPTVAPLADSEDEADDGEPKAQKVEVVEIDLNDDEDEDDDALLKEILAKKAVAAAQMPSEMVVTEEPMVVEQADEEDADDESEEDSEDDLSEEEDMTEEERRMQRKAAKRFIKADRRTHRAATTAGDVFEDEAEMSEDGGHTDDDDDDIQDDVDDVADAIDFREEQPEDERRAAARARAFAKEQQAQDDAELEKMKEMVGNGFKRKKNGLLDSEDAWQRKRRNADGEEESDSDDVDYGPVIERPEEAVELSDDDDGEWREQAARRRALHESGTQESLELPNAFEGNVSQEVYAAIKAPRMNSFHSESQDATQAEGWEAPLPRAQSMPAALVRTSSHLGSGSSAMLARQSSKTFLGKKRQVTKATGAMLGNSQASRSYVFGRTDSQSQWGGDDSGPATTFKEIGRDEDARAFGSTNMGPTRPNASEPKKKPSLFAMVSQTAGENNARPRAEDVQKAMKAASGK